MIQPRGVVRGVAQKIKEAAAAICESLRTTEIEQEPAFTDRLLQAIKDSLKDYKSKGISWSAKTLTDRGPGAQETEYGADFAGVLSIQVPDYQVRKGFLAQAKRIEARESIAGRDFDEMKQQCDRMLKRTPDSYVFLYTTTQVTVIPAIAIASSTRRNPHEFYSRKISSFFEAHFECFIGDRRIDAATHEMLERLEVRTVLFIEAKATDETPKE